MPYAADVPPTAYIAQNLPSCTANQTTTPTWAPSSHGRPRPLSGPPISAVVLTKNNESTLADTLHALAWCDEVVVFDTGSTDGTLKIAAQHDNVVIRRLTGPFVGFGMARREAVARARHDWILSIDSDEVISPELREEIAALQLDPRTVYNLPFQNFYDGVHITTCGWAPDRHERLFNRTHTNFCASDVHERIQTRNLRVVALRHPVRHYSYRRADDFLRKLHAYSDLFARQSAGRRSASMTKAVARSAWMFFKSYIIQRGAFQGAEGLLISAYKAQTVFWKYVLLREANRRLGRANQPSR